MKFLQSKRDIDQIKNYCPGPGYYYTSPNNPKFNDFYKATFFQNTTNIENNVMNFGTAKRFNYKANNKTPGPGQYLANSHETNKIVKKEKLLKNEGIHQKIKTIPSIPKSNQFYEELENKNFLIKKTDNKTIKDDLGPGFYDPSFSLVKPAIFKAQINHEILKKEPEKGTLSTNDLFLNLMNLKNKPKSWQKEFRIRREEVKSKGEFKEEESSNSFIIEKPQIKKKPEKINDERGKSLFVSHKYPLTDFYCEPDKMTAFQIKKKPENLQCFDTNTKRFKDENEIKPGPGDYNSEKYYQKHHKIAFYRSSAPRFKETQSAQYISDSISYSLNEEQKKNEKINFCQNPAIFGSGTKRFIDHKKIAPGPGDYNLSQSSFKEPKKRKKLIIMEFEPENTKEVGEETLLQENMDPKLLFENAENEKKMKKPTDELNEFYCSKNTSVFASKVGRFQTNMDDLNNETHNNVGPGTYHYHQEFVKASFNQNKHSVMPKSEKKGNFTEKTGGTKLGPGSYDYDFTRIKTKRFYNIKI